MGSALGACLLCALPSLAAAQAGAGSQAAAALLDRAAKLYGESSSLCAEFTQHLSVPLLGEEREGRGRLCQERPNRFAMRFSEPPGDAVVVDGTWVWVFAPSADATQVLRFPMARAPGGFDFHREFLEDWAAKYQVSAEGPEAVGGRPAQRLRLVPRAGATYQAAVVWIDAEGVLRRIRVEEENGSVRTVTLTSVEIGAAPPAGWFSFTPPPGVQVIGG